MWLILRFQADIPQLQLDHYVFWIPRDLTEVGFRRGNVLEADSLKRSRPKRNVSTIYASEDRNEQ